MDWIGSWHYIKNDKKQGNFDKIKKILKNFEKSLVFFKFMLYNDKVTQNMCRQIFHWLEGKSP